MAHLNQKAFERKLQNMSSTQDSIQTVSLWMIHHKKHAEDMVVVWLEQLKKGRALIILFFQQTRLGCDKMEVSFPGTFSRWSLKKVTVEFYFCFSFKGRQTADVILSSERCSSEQPQERKGVLQRLHQDTSRFYAPFEVCASFLSRVRYVSA